MIDNNFLRRDQFENAFKNAVVNFDPFRLVFIHATQSNHGTDICFEYEGKLVKFKLNRTQEAINKFANHFIEFMQTGIFDFNLYYQIQDIRNNEFVGNVYPVKLNIITLGPNLGCVKYDENQLSVIKRQAFNNNYNIFNYKLETVSKTLPEYILKKEKLEALERITISVKEYDYLMYLKEEHDKNL